MLSIIPNYNYFQRYARTKSDGTPGAINWDLASADFNKKCNDKGSVKEEDFKGAGVFLTKENNIVISSKDSIYDKNSRVLKNEVDGEIFVPLKTYPKPLKTNKDFSFDLSQYLQFFKSMSWEEVENGLILASFIPLSMVAGALSWRPHLWIYGDSSSGKSSIMKLIYKNILKDFAITHTKGTTLAGFTRTITGSASPVLFDEFEIDRAKDSEAVQACLEFMRLSNSSGFDISKADISTPYGVKTYKNYSCFLLGSINFGFESDADNDRILPLKLDSRNKNIKLFYDMKKNLNYKSLTQNLYALALDKLQALNSSYYEKMKDDTVQLDGHKKSLWAMLSSGSEIFFGESIGKKRFEINLNERRMEPFDFLMSHILWEFKLDKTVRDIIEEQQVEESMKSFKILNSLGIVVGRKNLVIHARSYLIDKIFHNTRHKDFRWVNQMPYARKEPYKIDGVSKRCLVIDLESVGLGGSSLLDEPPF